MNSLIKIRDISNELGVSVRTLRYYEEMGLITSIRENNTTERKFEEEEIRKLKQILVLRKMNISIKDIKMIFDSKDSETLLNVLDNKSNDIDNEIAELFGLKRL